MAFLLGWTVEEFWDRTPRDLQLAAEAYQDRRRDQIRTAVVGAFYRTVFDRQERPSLKEALNGLFGGPEAEPEKQTPEQMLKMVEILNAALGGEDLRTKAV